MIRINLLPRDERQVRRSIVMPKFGALLPVLVLLLVAALFTAFSVVQAMQVGRLKADIARAEQEAEKLRPQIQTIQELTQKREELTRRLNVITNLDKTRLWRVKLVDERMGAKPSLDVGIGRDTGGAKLTNVHEGGPAHQAGLSAGDIVIALRLTGQPGPIVAVHC